ncbi:uncharacterized protein LOC120500895 [Passer montanus]|uniref:uncharacterized protein LOC120500895 n=1 Tax=Passer montanus TaxID=9160 RepID=UPI0019602F07|nr:uncharacterized protein LOC120500895 [Passer montanus]
MQIENWKSKIVTRDLARSKRDLKELDSQCDSEITHWSIPEGVAWTVFLPWVSIAKSLGELAHLECWAAKQANLTSAVLSDLLSDKEVTRRATLQNRAAIDFLLSLHDHQCEEFEGLCCLNLSSKAEDARDSIKKMRDMIHDIKRGTSDWLGDVFSGWGLSGWASSILKTVLLILFILLVILIASSIIWKLVQKLIHKLVSPFDINQVVAEEEKYDPAEEEDQLEGEEQSEEDRWTPVPSGHPWTGNFNLDNDTSL